jgi:glutaminyl-peptide cyclotransferase
MTACSSSGSTVIDAAVHPPDVAPSVPDAAPDTPDAAPDTPDGAPDTPDAAPDTPDAAPDTPDAAPPDAAPPDAAPPDVSLPDVIVIPITMMAEYPHDQNAFTEGLAYLDGGLYESTGLYGSSTLRRVDPASGTVLQDVALAQNYFGEGIALVGDSIIQLTYREATAFVYDRTSFAVTGTFSFSGEGWGLCFDGTSIWQSNGTTVLTVRDPVTFDATRHLVVHAGDADVEDLNELECVGDDILANVWLTNEIVRIDKATGHVTAIYDASALPDTRQSLFDANAVLNGIAYHPDDDTFYVTGKLWPHLYQVKLPRP